MNPLAKLFAAFGKTPTEASGAAYSEALADMPASAVEFAVSDLVRSARFLPAPSEVLAEARKHIPDAPPLPERSRPLEEPVNIPLPTGRVVKVTREYYHDCDACDDSGWQSHWCPGGKPGSPSPKPWWDERRCERPHRDTDAGHTFATECPCVATNPTIQRRRHPHKAAA